MSIVVCADQLQRQVTEDDDVRHLVADLYKTINAEQYYKTKQRMLLARREQIWLQLQPLEIVRLMSFLICHNYFTHWSLLFFVRF